MARECLYVRSINTFFVWHLNLYNFQLFSSKHCVYSLTYFCAMRTVCIETQFFVWIAKISHCSSVESSNRWWWECEIRIIDPTQLGGCCVLSLLRQYCGLNFTYITHW